MSHESLPQVFKDGDTFEYEGAQHIVVTGMSGHYFYFCGTRDFLQSPLYGKGGAFWENIHQVVGVTPFELVYYPNYFSLEDLSKVVHYLVAPKPESTPESKPKRAPRRKEGIPESTYRWRNRKAALDNAEHLVKGLTVDLQTWQTRYNEAMGFPSKIAESLGLPPGIDQETILTTASSIMEDYSKLVADIVTIQHDKDDLRERLTEAEKWRTEYNNLSKAFDSRVAHLEEQVSLYKNEVAKKEQVITMHEGDLKRTTDRCLEIMQERDDVRALESGYSAALTERTAVRDALLKENSELHQTLKSLRDKNTQLLNENAQARRDAWSATYKLETLLSHPWVKFLTRNRLTKLQS